MKTFEEAHHATASVVIGGVPQQFRCMTCREPWPCLAAEAVKEDGGRTRAVFWLGWCVGVLTAMAVVAVARSL
jgi:hypothetical protein